MKTAIQAMLYITVMTQLLGCTLNFAPFSTIDDISVDKSKASKTNLGYNNEKDK